MTPDSVAASVYHAFVIRFAREFARAAIHDRDLSERWMDRADNGFIDHITSPWRWHSHLLALWEEGDEALIGRPWDELVVDALRGALDDLEAGFGLDEDAWRWGRVHALEFPHALGEVNPMFNRIFNRTLQVGGGEETVCQVASDPAKPDQAAWAPSWRMVADPVRPGALALAGLHRPVGPRDQRPLRRHPAALARGPHPADGRRGPLADAHLSRAAERRHNLLSRRDQITLTDDEQRQLLDSERVVIVGSFGPSGWPHLMPLWYVARDGEIWIWTYAKSQKVRNLERDPRATLLIETGHEYAELRGVQIEAEAEIHRDTDKVVEFAKELTVRYSDGIDSVEGDAAKALEAQAPKRVAIRFVPKRVASWDHGKLGGTY